jgi:uncharacterized YccA/Bax inhibitor family protein
MNKTTFVLVLIASAMCDWWMAFNGSNPLVPAIGGAIAGLVLVVIAAFKPIPYLAPGYAHLKVCLLGNLCHF